MDDDNLTLKERLDRIANALENKEKQDKKFNFKIPFRGKVSRRKIKKGWTTIMKIDNNKNITFERQPIVEQTTIVDEVPRLATTNHILFYKNRPWIIQPGWSTKPFSPEENLEDAIKTQHTTQGHMLLLNRMKTEVLKPKRTVSGLIIFGIVIGVIALGYFAIKSGMFH